MEFVNLSLYVIAFSAFHPFLWMGLNEKVCNIQIIEIEKGDNIMIVREEALVIQNAICVEEIIPHEELGSNLLLV